MNVRAFIAIQMNLHTFTLKYTFLIEKFRINLTDYTPFHHFIHTYVNCNRISIHQANCGKCMRHIFFLMNLFKSHALIKRPISAMMIPLVPLVYRFRLLCRRCLWRSFKQTVVFLLCPAPILKLRLDHCGQT